MRYFVDACYQFKLRTSLWVSSSIPLACRRSEHPTCVHQTANISVQRQVERLHGTDQTEFYQLLTYTDDVDPNAKLATWERFYYYNPVFLKSAKVLVVLGAR